METRRKNTKNGPPWKPAGTKGIFDNYFIVLCTASKSAGEDELKIKYAAVLLTIELCHSKEGGMVIQHTLKVQLHFYRWFMGVPENVS